MEAPLVTVICLCYNHDRFVKEAIESVFRQTHTPIQLIVVDDASTDNSVNIILETFGNRPGISFLPLTENLGNCRAFNKGLAFAKGDFIIDLAADDILLPNRIEKGLAIFAAADAGVGVQFSDAELIDEEGRPLGMHSSRYPHASVPQGEIYKDVIARYFICSPTMMIRKAVFDRMGGYDESLAYEDFDFWIRSSREYKYVYSPEAFVKRRIVSNSMSKNQYRRNSIQLASTFRVCEKIKKLNRTREEKRALRTRAMYELRKAIQYWEWGLALRYLELLIR